MGRAQQLEEHLQRAGGNCDIGGEHERADMLVVPVYVVMMVVVIVGIGLSGEPFLHVGDFPLRIVQAAVQQSLRRRLPLGRIEDRRGRVERAQARHDALALLIVG